MTDFTNTERILPAQLIEGFLYQNEGTALDFKSKQYRFNDATDDDKSELLKDILSFVNSWRQGDAFILIGVQAVNGGKHILIGTEEHFDDAQLQQFINSKTNRRVLFSYEVVLVEEKKIGVIRIPKQERPIYVKQKFGKVEKAVVYFRLGSSTAIATPDDIAKMGRDTILSYAVPLLNLKFAELKNRIELNTAIELTSIAYDEIPTPLPEMGEKSRNTIFDIPESTSFVNKDYWRELERYIRIHSLVRPVGLVLRNQGSSLAQQVRVEIIGSNSNGITVIDEDDLPKEPAYRLLEKFHFNRPFWKQKQTTVEHHGSQWTLTVNFGNVQAQSCVWATEPFYIGSSIQHELQLEASIYADNLPQPQKVPLTIKCNVTNKPALTLEILKKAKPQ